MYYTIVFKSRSSQESILDLDKRLTQATILTFRSYWRIEVTWTVYQPLLCLLYIITTLKKKKASKLTALAASISSFKKVSQCRTIPTWWEGVHTPLTSSHGSRNHITQRGFQVISTTLATQ